MRTKIIALVIFLFFVSSANIVFAAGPPDQQCEVSGTAWTTVIRDPQYILGQTFKPTQDRLSRIDLDLRGDGQGTVGMTLWKDGALVAFNANDLVDEPMGRGLVTFTFNDIELQVGQTYKIIPIYSIGNESLGWYYQMDCYADGSAYYGDTIKPFDFGFATYGFTYEEPAPLPDEGSDVAVDQTTISGQADQEEALNKILSEDAKKSAQIDKDGEDALDTGSAKDISDKSGNGSMSKKVKNDWIVTLVMLVILLGLAIALVYVKKRNKKQGK